MTKDSWLLVRDQRSLMPTWQSSGPLVIALDASGGSSQYEKSSLGVSRDETLKTVSAH